MRPTTPSQFRRTAAGAASAALLVAAAACADLATQPARTGGRTTRFALADSTVATAADTSLAASTADTTVVVAGSDPAPQLVVCPTTDAQSASEWIGPAGGSVSARGATITIPAGAVPDSTLFEVVVPAGRYMETDIHAVGVDHYLFQAPVTITINYARCPAGAFPANAPLQGVYVDTQTYQVLQQMGGVNYKSGHKVSFSTWHLSGYIIAY